MIQGFSWIRSKTSSFTSQNSLGWVGKALEDPGGKSRRGVVRAWPWIQFIPNFLDVEGKSQGIRQQIENSRQTAQIFGMEMFGFVGWGSCAGIGNSQG